MRITILSLFPDMFSGPLHASILKRAQQSGALQIDIVNPRDFTRDKHHIADDYPFGGGDGMVLKPDIMLNALRSICQTEEGTAHTVLLSPAGEVFNDRKARSLAQYSHIILICGHYEGIDERVNKAANEILSIGDYVLTGGEIPAMVITDAVSRMVPGVLGCSGSAQDESFVSNLLEYPQYTRPRCFEGDCVPELLLSGDHSKISVWRRKEALRKTLHFRPDLLTKTVLQDGDGKLILEIINEQGDQGE